MTAARLDLSAKFVPPESGGLVRRRLIDLSDQRVGVVLAPAGHGKTTLLGQIAAAFDGEVAWYRMDASDREPHRLALRLERTVLRAVGADLGPAGAEVPEATGPVEAEPLERLTGLLERHAAGRNLLLVLDDFHVVAGTASEHGLVRLVAMAPPGIRVLLSARRADGLDVAALRLSGGARVLDTDDLRFRSWEVEALFREVYQRPLAPDEAALLTRRTEGWAAGLAMFHLLTAARGPARRRQALADLARGSRLVRGYLVREMLGDVPEQLRDFLRRTSALGVLTGSLCDALLETTGSQGVLEELEQRRLFTTTTDDGHRFAYHQVLLDHLEFELTEQLGPAATREWYSRAAGLLLSAGEVPAAFRAYVRAEDWPAVQQLLHGRGAEVVATGLGPVEDLLPVALHQHDPWLLLARARALVAQGDLEQAVRTFQLARAASQDAGLANRCVEEARAAAVWMPEPGGPPIGWSGLAREATLRTPRRVLDAALALPGAHGRLVGGLASVLAGDPVGARRLLASAAAHPAADLDVLTMAACADALAELLTAPFHGDGGSARCTGPAAQLAELLTAETGGRPWLVRAGRALLAGRADPEVAPEADPDGWGRALVTFVDGAARREIAELERAAGRFTALGAPVPAWWAGCMAAALTARTPGTDAVGLESTWVQRARTLGLRDALAVVEAWAGEGEPRRSPPEPEPGDAAPVAAAAGPVAAAVPRVPAARSVAEPPSRPGPPEADVTQAEPVSAGEPRVGLRLLGGLEVTLHGQVVDLRAVRPRARSTLRFLALRAGDMVHRDTLAAELWPDLDRDSALRGVQVAVSSLRSLLDSGEASGSRGGLLVRVGQNYGLSLPSGCRSDVQELDRHLNAARAARAATDQVEERGHLRAAVRLYAGELLPEEGTAEWVLAERERVRLAVASAEEALARVLFAGGELDEAIDAVRAGVRLDPYRDTAWRLLVELHTAAGNPAAAEAARQEHGQVLAELGL